MTGLQSRFLAIMLVLYLAALSCSNTEQADQSEDISNYPDTRLDDAVIVFTHDGKQNVTIEAKHIDRWESEDSTEARFVEVIFYDDHGMQKSTLTAKRGLIREKSEKISMYGDVIAVNEDSTVLKTESLFWNPETGLITTDDYVEIERADGDLLTGYGLKADRHLHEIEILRDVAGRVKDITETEKGKSKEQ